MPTSPKTLMKSAVSLEDVAISPVIIGYFDGAVQSEAHEAVLNAFLKMAEEEGITRSFVARRLNKPREQITRWLGGPGNWTLDTLTNLALAIGYRPRISLERLSSIRQPNAHHPAISRARKLDNQPLEAPPPPRNAGATAYGKLGLVDAY